MIARRRISTRDRAKLFAAHNGICHLCGLRIQPGEAWEVSHPIPLAAGGADDETNWAPAHKKCHAHQTSEIDAPLIAKVRRVQARHIGAKQSSGLIRSRGFPPAASKDHTVTKRTNGVNEIARRFSATVTP